MDPNALIKEAGSRVTEIHLRNKKKETPLEALEDGDIDHYAIAATLKELTRANQGQMRNQNQWWKEQGREHRKVEFPGLPPADRFAGEQGAQH